jgi:uncharacterized protein HemX
MTITATPAPEATVIAAVVLPAAAPTAAAVGLPADGAVAAATAQPATSLLGTALGALAALLLLPLGIGTAGYLLWQVTARLIGRR